MPQMKTIVPILLEWLLTCHLTTHLAQAQQAAEPAASSAEAGTTDEKPTECNYDDSLRYV